VKKDRKARRDRPTSDSHTEEKKQNTSENCSSTPGIKMPYNRSKAIGMLIKGNIQI
jgi:hypothetical protein